MIKLKKINDLNIHPIKLNKDLSSTINEDKNINFNQIEYFIRYFKKENLEFKNIMIMNENFFFNNKNFTKFSLLYQKTNKFDFTYYLDSDLNEKKIKNEILKFRKKIYLNIEQIKIIGKKIWKQMENLDSNYLTKKDIIDYCLTKI